jgi:hypothetical protein
MDIRYKTGVVAASYCAEVGLSFRFMVCGFFQNMI